jgi:hypothetical protein
VTDYDYDDELEQVPPCVIPEVERRRRKIRRLYGPDGRVLRSYSSRPPVGFHQGQRGEP